MDLGVAVDRGSFNVLPNEILSDIFLFLKPPVPHLFQDALPHNLLQVCRRWRDVAENTARLWVDLEFDIYHDQLEGRLDQLPGVLSVWIRRSNPLPVSIKGCMSSAVQQDALPHGRGKATRSVVRIMCAVAHRWRDIEVTLPHKEAVHIMDAARKRARTCERLVVDVTDSYCNRLHLMELPVVPDIDIRGLSATVDGKADLTSLRFLVVDSLSIDDFMHLISFAPNLERVQLQFNTKDMGYQGDPVLAQKLSLLDITFDVADASSGVEDGFGVLRNITAPSLTTLRLLEMGETPSEVHAVEDFIQRSGCTLQHFFYNTDSSSDSTELESISNICKIAPSLEILDVRTFSGWDEFLEFLQDRSDLQLLKKFTLELGEWNYVDDYMDLILDFSAKRCEEEGKLESVTFYVEYIHPGGEESENAVGFLGELERRGVQFCLEQNDCYSGFEPLDLSSLT